ncbi:MAG: hypothetical protein KBG20_13095 [Caldilineaceae bacterium]|nr:hypothetical protein [Caldilineaceae bacterium]MBP8109480.1 hypothetical protein [Caldilineaceae bacterium]MBP8124215.1 hypothetical protein [Caldilineaceae bacterium]MBP9073233.1 hypothetical protein [Caldilineaceae bacterium]
MARGQWVFDPGSGGVNIPEAVKRRTSAQIQTYATQHFSGKYTRLAIRFRSQFCYIDAFTEPHPPGPDWPPADWPESREEYLERLRTTPTHLCRLRYFGSDDRWGLAFYTYSNETYQLSVYDNGEFFGRAEDAFRIAASLGLE